MNRLKPFLGFALIALAFGAGLSSAAWSTILGLTALFTVAYIQDKWHLWRPLVAPPQARVLPMLAVTALIQAIVVTVLFGVGRVVRTAGLWLAG